MPHFLLNKIIQCVKTIELERILSDEEKNQK